nr:hypothetical protein [Tanacetum cinerariifolium]
MLKQREQAANLAVQKEQEEQATQSFTPYWNSPMINDEEVLQAREKFMKAIQTFLQKQAISTRGDSRIDVKLLGDVRNINEDLSEFTNSPSWDRPMVVDDKEHSIQCRLYLDNSSNAIAPVLPTEEPEYSLSMGDEHLSNILEMKSDELIKSSVENLVPIPSEYEVTSDNESECDVPVKDESSPIFTTFLNPLFDYNDDFTSSDDGLLFNEDVPMENFKIYSNPLFDDEEISNKIDPHYFNAESNLIESLPNQDTLFDSPPKFDYLEEFSSEFMPTSIINEWRIKREHKEYISIMENNSQREEIDLLLDTDDLMPPGIENDDYDSEGNIHFLKELLSNDSIPLPENESSNFDHHDDPSFPRPPPEPPDVEVFFDFEPNSGELISAVMNNIDELNEDECFDPGGAEIVVFENIEDDNYFPFIFVIRIFLPYLTYPEVSPLPFSTRNEDTIFDPGIST